jgi:predicted RNase H-like nuclease (RuvC/YqgF family)
MTGEMGGGPMCGSGFDPWVGDIADERRHRETLETRVAALSRQVSEMTRAIELLVAQVDDLQRKVGPDA